MGDGTGLAEALLGLEGFRVLDVVETVELMVLVETTADFTGCSGCGVRAVAQGLVQLVEHDAEEGVQRHDRAHHQAGPPGRPVAAQVQHGHRRCAGRAVRRARCEAALTSPAVPRKARDARFDRCPWRRL